MQQNLPPQPERDITLLSQNISNFRGNFNMDKSGFNPSMPGHTADHNMRY